MRHSGEWRRRGDLPREFNLNGASSESPRKPVVADVNRHLVPSRITIGTAVAITRNRGQLGSESQAGRGESLYPPIPPTLGTGAWPVASPGHTNPPCPHLFSTGILARTDFLCQILAGTGRKHRPICPTIRKGKSAMLLAQSMVQ